MYADDDRLTSMNKANFVHELALFVISTQAGHLIDAPFYAVC
ncbi:hypothetical protein KCQ_05051 [Pectobacterium atrosepticum ICMP 1526]|nr:hypothetical protein KCQ_05051 [Pectobacterium atrosepticum ICMP 1526]